MKKGRILVQRTIIALGVLALLAPLTLVGCAQQRQWAKRGLNQAEFDQDTARCKREAAKATYQDPYAYEAGQGLERTITQEKVFEQCMFSKGYRLESSASGR
ncbi:hypothetical protein [uncultured Desulfobulbus sp.]|uniref:hypothetical protein n=1 Tax=uncultured Desulfobulbus sp. TaxID=239745 RepID=UPI0029C9571D|nr:hypothetical protein [uncultured Desulfobulbus sp.]